MNWVLLKNSLLVSALATALAMAFGFVAALFLMALGPRSRRWLLAAAAMVLALPPFLATNCWLHLLGLTGVWHAWLPFDIYSLSGAIWILALMLWPISLFLVLGAWQRVEQGQLEAEPGLTGGLLIAWLLGPLARAAAGQAAVITFVLALNNFAVPALLQIKVFPAEVWISFNTAFDYAGALAMSWPLIVAPLLLLWWFRHREIAWPRVEGTVAAGVFRRQLGVQWFWSSGIVAATALFLSAGLPLADLCASTRTWTEFWPALKAGQGAALNSFLFPAVTATFVTGISLTSWRWPLGTVLWLPFLVPGVLLGIALIFIFNHRMLDAFYHSVGIVFLAWTLRYLAVGWNTTAQAMRSVDRDLTDASRLEGAARWAMFRWVQWPQIAPLAGAAWYVTYLLCLWDTETLILIMPPGAETLSVRAFNFLHYGHNAQVNAVCLILLALAVLPLLLVLIAAEAGKLGKAGKFLKAGFRSSPPCLLLVSAVAIFNLAGCSPENSSGESTLESKLFSHVEVIGTQGGGLGQFNKPMSVTVDERDNFYVVDMTARVQKFSPGGKFLAFWQMTQSLKGEPKGMCRDRNGNIVVLEPHYPRVNLFTPEGKLLTQWGEHGTNAGQLSFPRSVIVNTRGDIFVCEFGVIERVQQFTAGGKRLIRVFGRGGEGEGEFNRAEGLGIDRQDRLYVADSCNHRIQIFSPQGKFLSAYGKPGTAPGELSYPYDVKVDAEGNQFVCEYGNSRIQVFDADNRPVEVIGGPGAAPGQFSNPRSIALDSKGNLYVADSMNHRVQKLVRKRTEANAKPFKQTRGRIFRGSDEAVDAAVGAKWTAWICGLFEDSNLGQMDPAR